MPNGFVAFSRYLAVELPKQDLFWWVSKDGKIMSTYGAAFFELGIFGALIPLGISTLIFYGYPGELRRPLLIFLFTNIILLTSIPLTYPPIGFLMGCLLFRGHAMRAKKLLLE